jgi:uncharacterized ubiquitin-like protein YukD
VSTLEEILPMLSYVATPIVAVAAVRIAWEQTKINRQKLVLDRYDRRLRIYEEVKRLLSIVTRDADIAMEDLLKFRVATTEADFLFGSDVTAYIDGLYKHAVDLAMWNSMYRDSTQQRPPDYDHKTVVEGKHRELKWITSQYEPSS